MSINVKNHKLRLFVVACLIITNLLTFSAKAAMAPVKVCLTPMGKYMAAKKLTSHQVYELLRYVGFKGHSLKVAWAVAMKETHGNPQAHNYNPRTGDDSYGVFQINLYGALKGRLSDFHLKSAKELTNPVTNAQIAYKMSSGGKNWSAWHANPGERDHKVVQMWLKLCPEIV